jgi:hypothetical protein
MPVSSKDGVTFENGAAVLRAFVEHVQGASRV